jgi:hypothetical protein
MKSQVSITDGCLICDHPNRNLADPADAAIASGRFHDPEGSWVSGEPRSFMIME